MAVTGGATTGYVCQVQDGELVLLRNLMIARGQCVDPAEAIPLLGRGERVTVAGRDVAKLRQLLGSGDAE